MLKLLLLFALVALINADFKNDCLNAHNSYRAKHSAAPLRINNGLQNTAQNWANYLASNNVFKHSGRSGENIYASTAKNVNGKQPVDSWYKEISLYNWNNPGYSDKTGHFTQVVWIGSTDLGCASASNGKKTYVVANYNPPGNMKNQFPQNVKPN